MQRKRLRVAACQMRTGEDVEENASRVVAALKESAGRGMEVAAFHEGVLYGYSCRPGFWRGFDQGRIVKAERRIIRACKRLRIAAVVGSTHVEDGRRYNSLLIVDRDGALRWGYVKIHLAGEKWWVR